MDWPFRSVDVAVNNKLFTKALTMSFLITPLKTRSGSLTHIHIYTHTQYRKCVRVAGTYTQMA